MATLPMPKVPNLPLFGLVIIDNATACCKKPLQIIHLGLIFFLLCVDEIYLHMTNEDELCNIKKSIWDTKRNMYTAKLTLSKLSYARLPIVVSKQ